MLVYSSLVRTYYERQPYGAGETAKHMLRDVQHVHRGNLVVIPFLSTFATLLHSAVVG